ncbi:hypothetical protein COS75_03010 [Candidatus Pacearchaeota archaeon CG06_land_8_20_14_3_00_35_12]|nr:MAG: hypothetical protein COS75_03010 [Candidatus Pacearchaeota archaeon CG06_land_8_20_14_3_00_35_12]
MTTIFGEKRKMKKSLLILSLLIALFCISFASAFDVSADNKSSSVCTSSTLIANDLVSLSANESASTFSVTISGTASAFTTTVPYSFSLNSGQNSTIYSYITPSSKTAPGNYELIVKVGSNGVVKESRHSIIVADCRGAEIKIDSVRTACPCQTSTMILQLKNNGMYVEDYSLAVQGSLKNYVTLSQTRAVLGANQSTEISVVVNTTCNLLGNYDISFIASSNGITRATATTNYPILPCYEYEISTAKDSYLITEHENLTIPVSIKNDGTMNNTYKINLYGPSWARLENKEISAGIGGTANTNLLLNPDFGTTGNFSLKLDVMSTKGTVEKTKEIQIAIEKAYAVSIDVLKDKDIICNAQQTSYDVKVQNLGKYTSVVDLALEGPEWVNLSANTLTLASNEEKIIKLNAAPPYPSANQDYTVKIKASDSISKTSSADTIIITSATKEYCFAPSITIEKTSVSVNQDSAATLLVTIENKGKSTAQYIVEIAGTAANFVKLNPSVISVEPSKAQTLYLYIAPPVTMPAGDYDISISAKMNETAVLASKEVKINVVSTEIELPAENKTNETAGENGFVKFWKDLGTSFKNLYIKFITLFAKKESNVTKAENVTNISITITNLTNISENKTLSVNITANITNATEEQANATNATNVTANKTANATKTAEVNKSANATNESAAPKIISKIPTITVAKNSSKTIDMNDYFSDPNNKSLEFMVFKQQNLKLAFNDSKLTISSTDNSSDKYVISVYSTNGKEITPMNFTVVIGQSASANMAKTWDTIKEFCITYAYYLLGAIVLVIIIIIFSSGFYKKLIAFFEEEVPEKEKAAKKENNKN